MKQWLLLFCGVAFFSASMAQKTYQYSIDLNKVDNDQITVDLKTPVITSDSILFHLPKMVPGTYAIHNYGSYIQDLVAFDKAGRPLEVIKKDKNSWLIKNARSLARIQYKVDDTWDTPSIKEDIFEPAGTNIAKDSIYAINTFGFFGYFNGLTELPFEVSIQKPEGFFGATSLSRSVKSTAKTDVFTATNYHFLADAPMLYAKPDTATLKIGQTNVLIAVYSPNNKLKASYTATQLKPVLEAQKNYLGGKLPVNNYAFLIYLSNNPMLMRYGALEHSFSSFYYLPENMEAEELAKNIKDVASHEFLHIVTPLNIHSEEIGNFDYINPKMSKHLWLYEGLTEYAAHHAQVAGGLITEAAFLERMQEKIKTSRTRFNDTLAFTKLSLGALDKYKNQYENVYQKGALIGLCLDIQLRHWSNGKYGTQELMQDLSKQFGKNKSFKDQELFSIIGKLSNPSIEQFLTKYVDGPTPLPLDSVFQLVGIRFTPKDTVLMPEIGFGVGFAPIPNTDTLMVNSTIRITGLGKRVGLRSGDKLVQFNDQPFNMKTYMSLFQPYSTSAKAGDKVSWTVLRKNKDQNWEEKRLEATIQNEPKIEPTLKVEPNATTSQINIKKAWLHLK